MITFLILFLSLWENSIVPRKVGFKSDMGNISRRDFLKTILLGATGLSLLNTGAQSYAGEGSKFTGASLPQKLKKVKESPGICAFCGCGCGIILYSTEDKLLFVEGDPDHPINEGTICPKANAITDVRNVVDKRGQRVPNQNRITQPMYRAPGSNSWEEKKWDWVLNEVAKRIKKTRDESFEEKDINGVTVNRCLSIATLGSASLDNEENYLLHKMFRSWGIVNMEHHARL